MKRIHTIVLVSVFLAMAGIPAMFSPPEAAAQCSCCSGADQSCSCGCTDKQNSPQDMDLMKAGVCTCSVHGSSGNAVMLPESFTPLKNDMLPLLNRRFAEQTSIQGGIKIILSLNNSPVSSIPLFLLNSSFLL